MELKRSGCKEKDCDSTKPCKVETRNFGGKEILEFWESHMMIWGASFCFFCAGLGKLVFAGWW